MKKYLLLALAVALATVLIPAAMCARQRRRTEANAVTAAPAAPAAEAAAETPEGETIRVFMSASGAVEELSMREYVICAVAGEMPAAYEPEALRAQALASVTLARYLQSRAGDLPEGAAVSTDPGRHQAYMSVDEMRERWGENFAPWYEKLCAAADDVLPLVISYDGAPIMAAFHAVSPGATESAENVWGKAVPYLVSCASAGDKLSPGYASAQAVPPAELAAALELTPGEADPADWFENCVYSEAGTLLSAEICGKTVTGAALREALLLRSAAIRPTWDGQNFILSVSGYGHGVGMSQYGADYYARQGMDYRQIIAHYYPGTQITEYFH